MQVSEHRGVVQQWKHLLAVYQQTVKVNKMRALENVFGLFFKREPVQKVLLKVMAYKCSVPGLFLRDRERHVEVHRCVHTDRAGGDRVGSASVRPAARVLLAAWWMRLEWGRDAHGGLHRAAAVSLQKNPSRGPAQGFRCDKGEASTCCLKNNVSRWTECIAHAWKCSWRWPSRKLRQKTFVILSKDALESAILASALQKVVNSKEIPPLISMQNSEKPLTSSCQVGFAFQERSHRSSRWGGETAFTRNYFTKLIPLIR